MDTTSKGSPRKSLKRHQPGSSQAHAVTFSKQSVHQRLQSVQTKRGHTVKDIRDRLSGANNSSDTAETKKEIYLLAIKELNNDLYTPSEAKELIGVLIAEVNDLEGSVLVQIIEFFIEGIKNGSITNGVSLELFPYVLENIGKRQSVTMGDPPTKMDGMDCKSHLINSLFGCRDINLLPDELKFLVEKLLRVMSSLPYEELPPLVHQLLVMSRKGHTVMIMEGILELFNQFDKEEIREGSQEVEGLMEVGRNRDALYTVEGTALLHFNQALLQNQSLRTEFFKRLKTAQPHVDSLYVSPFSLALALSLTKMSTLSETIFSHLKSIVVKSFKHKDDRRASCWIRELSGEDAVVEIKDVFLHVVEHSVFGWDPVLQGLFNFAFELMSTVSSKTLSGTPQLRACSLGGTILLKCFEKHPVVRLEALNQLINRILENAMTSYVDHYICVVAEVARSVPQVVLEGTTLLKDSLSFMNSIPSASSVKLMQAILPLVQYKASVRDSLLIVLRKLLFSKQLECRLSAVGGYLLLLKHFKVLGIVESCGSSQMSSSQFSYSSQSQTLVEVHSSSVPQRVTVNESVCLEILGALRRCFSQQDKVKLTLYEGVYDVICNNTKLAGPVLEILLNQFKNYYEEDTDLIPPVKLEQCSSTSSDKGYCRKEPLAHLLCCIQRCARKLSELGDAPPILDKVRTVLDSLSQRLVRTELSDFELDRAGDYSSASTVGIKNTMKSSIVMGLYETLMDYVFASGQFSQESCVLAFKLYSGYQNIHDLLVEKGVGVTGRRGSSSTPGGRFSCLLPMASVVFILKAVFNDVIPAHQVALAKFRETASFVKYIINTTLLKIQLIEDQASPWEWGSRSVSSLVQKNFESGCVIGRILLKQINRVDLTSREGSKKEKGKSVQVLCLEGFGQLCHVMVTCYPSQADQFLTSLLEAEKSNATDVDASNSHEKTLYFIKQFQHLMVNVFTGSSKSYTIRDIPCMLNITKLLSDRLDPDSPQLKQVFEWNLAQCKEQSIDDISVVKSLVGFILSLDYSIQGNLKLVRKFAQDVHYHVGDVDEDVQFSGSSNFTSVTPQTSTSAVFTPLCDQIDNYLNDAIIIKNISLNETTVDSSQSERLVTDLCERIVHLVLAFNELVQTSLPNGPLNEVLTKSLIKLYEVLADTAKYQLDLYSNESVILPQFRKLVDNVGQHLQQQVYNFILYVQESQGDQGVRGRGSKKGKGPLTSGKTQVKKEARFIPKLIYIMEQLENQLIRISKKSKENLMDNFKRSVARDFRIKDNELNAILHEHEEEENSEEEKDKENEGAPPVSKKSKKK